MPAKWPNAQDEYDRGQAVSSGKMTYLELLGFNLPGGQTPQPTPSQPAAGPGRATNTPAAQQQQQVQQGADAILQAILAELKGLRTDSKSDAKSGHGNRGQPARRRGLLGRLGQAVVNPTRRMAGIGRFLGRHAGGAIGRKHSWATGHKTGRPGLAKGARIGGAVGAGALGGVTAVATGAMLAAVALKMFHDAVNRATEAQISQARHLAEVSGSMAAVMANRDISEMFRDIRKGENQAGSMKELVDAEQKRKNASEPLVNAMENAQNRILAALNETLVPMLNVANNIMEGLKELPFGVGEAIKRLTEGNNGAGGTELDKAMGDISVQVAKVNAKGQKMLDIARDAAKGGRGRVFPGGGRV